LRNNSDQSRFWEGHEFTGCGKTLVLDFALKGRGFSRAVSLAKSMAALAADAPPSYQNDFFRSLFTRAVKSLKMCPRFSA
jgi:glycine/D-amino acid oxidase-like deaminating enzyme